MSLDYLSKLNERNNQRQLISNSDISEEKNVAFTDTQTTSLVDNVTKNSAEKLEEVKMFETFNSINDIIGATNFIKSREISSAINQFFTAHMLKKIKEQELFRPKYTNFLDYIRNELDYKKSKAYKLITVAEKYPINDTTKEIIEMGIYKLSLLSNIHHENLIQYIRENNLMQLSVRNIEKMVKENRANNVLSLKEKNNEVFDFSIIENFKRRIADLSENISKINEQEKLNESLYNDLYIMKKEISLILNMIDNKRT